MRIVVSAIGTPTRGIAEYLVKLIQPVLNKNETMLKNSWTFVRAAKTWETSPLEIQVSYDVFNSYSSVAVKEATNVMVEMISKHVTLIQKVNLLNNVCLNIKEQIKTTTKQSTGSIQNWLFV